VLLSKPKHPNIIADSFIKSVYHTQTTPHGLVEKMEIAIFI